MAERFVCINAITALDHPRQHAHPKGMNIPEPDTTIEHRCEALTISEIPPYRCTTSATGARRGREVCASHAQSLDVHWFDAGVPQLQS
jgi:hypothetical protein